MYPNINFVVKGSKRSRQPLQRLPKTHDNKMPLPSGKTPPFDQPILSFNSTAMDVLGPPYPATTSAQPSDNITPPPIQFATPSLDILDQSYQQVGNKRKKIDHGCSVSPSRDVTGNEGALMHGRGGTSGEGAAAEYENPESLALPEDKRHLTELHCFVRRHNLYIFCADANEIGVPKKGRKKALSLGQVGIGCAHCRYCETKLKSSTYFPSSISGIYNACMIIQQRHFPVCENVSEDVHAEYNKLKVLTARSASTKEYWVWAAQKLGLIDTKEGVFFHSNVKQTTVNVVAHPQIVSPETLPSLVETSDKIFATEYAYYVLSQMTKCHFTESDRLGKRKKHVVGFPGLACRYCYGGNGSGRFFPLTLKTFSDVSKSLHVLSNHLQKCPKCPREMSAHVMSLAENHEIEKTSQPFGTQKIFFELIWKRLHPELLEGQTTAPVDEQSLKPEEYPSPPSELVQASNEAQMPSVATKLPSLPAEKNMSELYKHDQCRFRTCLIPKKRYCMQGCNDNPRSREHDPSFPPIYPMQRESVDPSEYTATDVSAALILASGFEKTSRKTGSLKMEEV